MLLQKPTPDRRIPFLAGAAAERRTHVCRDGQRFFSARPLELVKTCTRSMTSRYRSIILRRRRNPDSIHQFLAESGERREMSPNVSQCLGLAISAMAPFPLHVHVWALAFLAMVLLHRVCIRQRTQLPLTRMFPILQTGPLIT